MFPIPWYAILLISIPQTILGIKIGYEMFGLKVGFGKCFAVSLMVGIITFFLRRTSIIPGIHTIIIIALAAILVTILADIKIWYSLAGSLLGFMIMGVLEGLWLPIFLKLSSHTLADLALNPWLNVEGYVPIALTALIIYILIQKKELVIFNFEAKGNG